MTDETVVQPQSPAGGSDINVDAIFFRRCLFEDRLFEAAILTSGDPPAEVADAENVSISTKIGVFVAQDERSALVQLAVAVEPEAQPTWTATVEVVGRYSVGEHPIIPVQRFAWNNGIAYLVPFVREKLASLTSQSIFGTFLLPPLSVPALLRLAQASNTAEHP